MNNLKNILSQYQNSFIKKIYSDENNDYDILMDIFSITPDLKRENRQYWGRELGMCWQLLVTETFRKACPDSGPAIRIGKDEPCDLTVEKYAIDTKYRIGSGDSGTLKKFKSYGSLLKDEGFEPVLLILRNDNLPSALNAFRKSGWLIYTGEYSFNLIRTLSGFDLKSFLKEQKGKYDIKR